MGIRRTYSEVADRITNGTDDFLDLVLDGTKSFACFLWKTFPDQIAGKFGAENSPIRGVTNALCKNDPIGLPPAPETQFLGGQCSGTVYRPRACFTTPNGNECINLNPLAGKIEDMTFNINEQPGGTQWVPFFSATNENGQTEQASGGFRPLPVTNLVLDNPVFSGVDNCGDPPKNYPSTNPTPQDYESNITIIQQDGLDLTLPIIYAPISFSFPMRFEVGDIIVNFDLGGFEVEFGDINIGNKPELAPSGDLHPLPAPRDDIARNRLPKSLPTPDTGVGGGQLAPIVEDVKTPTDPKQETRVEQFIFVEVILTAIPANAKRQFGNGADDVVYCGWFEWKIDDNNLGARIPIHFEKNAYIAPLGVNGYAYTLYTGYEGFAKVYTRNL